MERELGVPWEDVFASIDPHPLAAGTIAQVHRATLEDGQRVVIKIQRPTAERDIHQEISACWRCSPPGRPGRPPSARPSTCRRWSSTCRAH
jgi:predicted unusual protein kinase regulating ubiquinone biosynthesis (AarF/ABC1/UbiB family)